LFFIANCFFDIELGDGIGRILKVHHTTVLNWIKKIGQSVEMPVSGEPVITAELDEIHTYVKKKLQMGMDCR
jgi:hypothetical protein